MTKHPTLGVIGAGKVGTTLSRLWAKAGYKICAVHSRTGSRAIALAAQVNATAVPTPAEVVELSELTLLTVPDDRIGEVAREIHHSTVKLSGKAIVHTSGARDAQALTLLAERGALTGSLHPAYPFADVDHAMTGLPGATFAVEAGHDRLRGWLGRLVAALNGSVLVIPAGHKATYHVALAIASNFTVTLYAVAEQLLTSLGTDRTTADNALNALLAGTIANLQSQGIPQSMVGPLTREDVGTIAAHLATLHEVDATLVEVYTGLARLSYPMLAARGIATDRVEQLFKREKNDATDNP